MSIPLLENKLVQKYFAPDPGTRVMLAYRILLAMTEPIKQGERYLELSDTGIVEKDKIAEFDMRWFHALSLRLPDQFQAPECCEYRKYQDKINDGAFIKLCEKHFKGIQSAITTPETGCECYKTPGGCSYHKKPETKKCHDADAPGIYFCNNCQKVFEKPDPVESKMEDILIKRMGLGMELRELVNLARRHK